jgi:transposase
MPALPTYLIEPIWEQFSALLPERETDHPLGCHRRRISDRVVFEKLVQVLVFGCAYERIADEGVPTPPCAVGATSGSPSGRWRRCGR